MKYLGSSFSVHPGENKAYRDNFDEVFGKKKPKKNAYQDAELPAPKDFKPEPVEKKPKPKKKKVPKKK